MSKSDHLLEEDSSWAQTFFTVTPQDDGFLREIEDTDTVIVSGNADVPMDLETWNIVLRRSLLNTTKDFIDPKELEEPESIETECQTYLQGVPKVDLPLIYRDEATQTLYIGKDEEAPFERAFEDVITVMNDKPLPEWKKSENVQTKITFENTAPFDDIIQDLQTNITDADLKKSDPMISAGVIESSDALNFMVERALWMSEPVAASKIETKEAEMETMIKYDNALKKLMIDHETQTDLSWNPTVPNSMFLSESKQNESVTSEKVISSIRRSSGPIPPEEYMDIAKYEDDNDTRKPSSQPLDSEKNEIYNASENFGRKTIDYEKNKSDNGYEENENDEELEDFDEKTIGEVYLGSFHRYGTVGTVVKPTRESNDIAKEDYSGKTEKIGTGVKLSQSPLYPDPSISPERKASQIAEYILSTDDTLTENGDSKTNDVRKETMRTSYRRKPTEHPVSWKLSFRETSTNRGVQKTENILLTTDNSYVSRNREEAGQDPNLRRACSSRERMRSFPNDSTSSHDKVSYDMSSSSLHSEISPSPSINCRQELPASDERALKLLKNAFCPEKPVLNRNVCRCPSKPERRILRD